MTTSALVIRPDDIRLRQANISDAQAVVALLSLSMLFNDGNYDKLGQDD